MKINKVKKDKNPKSRNQNKNCLHRSKEFRMSNKRRMNRSIESPEKLIAKQK